MTRKLFTWLHEVKDDRAEKGDNELGEDEEKIMDAEDDPSFVSYLCPYSSASRIDGRSRWIRSECQSFLVIVL